MNNFTFEEKNLVCLYSGGRDRLKTIAELETMRGYLAPDEDELRSLTDSALAKLRDLTDAEYDALDLFPDFDAEDAAYGE